MQRASSHAFATEPLVLVLDSYLEANLLRSCCISKTSSGLFASKYSEPLSPLSDSAWTDDDDEIFRRSLLDSRKVNRLSPLLDLSPCFRLGLGFFCWRVSGESHCFG